MSKEDIHSEDIQSEDLNSIVPEKEDEENGPAPTVDTQICSRPINSGESIESGNFDAHLEHINETDPSPEAMEAQNIESGSSKPEESDKLFNGNYVKAWLGYFFITFSFMLLMPLFPLYLKEAFDADNSTIGLVLSGYTIATLLIRPFSGYIVDTFSRRKVLLITSLIFAAFFAGYIIAGTLLMFALIRTLHGLPFGIVTVSENTVAIDVLPSKKRAEGIGYFGLSNNIATAISPSIALWVFAMTGSYKVLFWLALIVALGAFVVNLNIKQKVRPLITNKQKLSLDRFFLAKGWSQAVCMVCFAFSYGVMSTYVAIYGQSKLGITEGTGLFFLLLAVGLMISRLTGARSLRKRKIVHNAVLGSSVSIFGYLIFAIWEAPIGYYLAPFIIGLGNGHMYPAFQNMFVDLAPHERRGTASSTLLISWDLGMGLGVLIGGVLSQYFTYGTAFFIGFLVNVAGVAFFNLYAKPHFLKYRLR